MDSLLGPLAALVLVALGYTVGSTKIINQGNEALVERLGKFNRKLSPGLNFIVPLIDSVVVEDTLKEQVLDTKEQEAITKDNVALKVDAVTFWRILELERTHYAVDNIYEALENLVLTALRSEIGGIELANTYSSRNEINHALLQQLDEATATWGVKVTRVEIQNITVKDEDLRKSLEAERAAESKKQAAIKEAEGKRQAAIAEANGTVAAIELISRALQGHQNPKDVLQYLIAQKYVDASFKIGESNNSKVVFMNPSHLTEAISDLLHSDSHPGDGNGSNPN
jgi:regulator of protease activity HflC (stomatin/prohibitin superfamily)